MVYRYVSFAILIVVILFLIYVFYRVMAGFFLPLFLAALLVVIFNPLHNWFLQKCRQRPRTSALLTTAAILLVVLLPLSLLLIFAAAESRMVIQQLSVTEIQAKAKEVRTSLNLDMPAVPEFDDLESVIDSLNYRAMTDIEDVRSNLSELIGAARVLGDELDLEWSPAFSSSEDEQIDSTIPAFQLEWKEFVRQLLSARDHLDELEKEVPPGESISASDIPALHVELRGAIASFVSFKNTLLGGSTWAWFKEMANPSSDELGGYVQQGLSFLQTKLLTFGTATTAFLARTVFGAAIMIIALYFFLLDGPKMLQALKSLSPLEDQYEDKLISEFDQISRAVVVATLLSAVVQGVLAAIGFYFVGLQAVFLLMMLTTLFALIPFVGAAAVWVPACLWLYFIDGRLGAAVGLTIYGLVIISTADNVIKPLVLHGQSKLHPLWALLSILGGVTAFGPIGILVGPMILAFLQTLLEILKTEISVMDATTNAATDAGPLGTIFSNDLTAPAEQDAPGAKTTTSDKDKSEMPPTD